MKEKNVAKNYANALYQIGKDLKVNFADELTKLTEVINSSNNLENLLFLGLFSNDEKIDVLKEICSKINLNPAVTNSILFLIEQRRINLLPLIITEIIQKDDEERGFIRGFIEGSDTQCDPEFENTVKAYLKKKLGKDLILNYKINENISAGYKVTIGDIQYDASVDNQLKNFKESILG